MNFNWFWLFPNRFIVNGGEFKINKENGRKIWQTKFRKRQFFYDDVKSKNVIR